MCGAMLHDPNIFPEPDRFYPETLVVRECARFSDPSIWFRGAGVSRSWLLRARASGRLSLGYWPRSRLHRRRMVRQRRRLPRGSYRMCEAVPVLHSSTLEGGGFVGTQQRGWRIGLPAKWRSGSDGDGLSKDYASASIRSSGDIHCHILHERLDMGHVATL
ncbi:hypothetical protein BJV74DRAFT_173249 [Russula compacta]|nr:hypothetical protein BJV74DRAFT_173249 [Russula compacta]